MHDRLRKYARPLTLSDPNCDFSEEALVALLHTPDHLMGFEAFACLFQGKLPAGTYDEVIYFFPKALDYILEEKAEWDSLFVPFVVWIQDNETRLREDHLWEEIWRKVVAKSKEKLNHPFRLKRSTSQWKDSLFYPLGEDWLTAIEDALTTFRDVYHEPCHLLPKVEALFIERFNAIASYDAAAWFIYLEQTCTAIPALTALAQDHSRKAAALYLIREQVITNDLHLRFWDRILGNQL